MWTNFEENSGERNSRIYYNVTFENTRRLIMVRRRKGIDNRKGQLILLSTEKLGFLRNTKTDWIGGTFRSKVIVKYEKQAPELVTFEKVHMSEGAYKFQYHWNAWFWGLNGFAVLLDLYSREDACFRGFCFYFYFFFFCCTVKSIFSSTSASKSIVCIP